MYQHRSHLLRAGPGGRSDEGQDGQSVFWDAHVRPLGVMVMEDCVFNSPLRYLEDQSGYEKPNLKATLDYHCIERRAYLICSIPDSERPECVVSKCLGVFQCHLIRPILFLVLLWPVLITFCL